MAGVSSSVYEFDNMVRAQDVYKSLWTSLIDWYSKTRKWIPVQKDNEHDKYTINHQL